MKKPIAYACMTIFLAGCFSAKLLIPTQNDVDRVQVKFAGYTLGDLNRGKSLYEQNCGSCHGLKSPSSRNEQEWNSIVPGMVKKVNKKNMILDAKAQNDILKYVITMGSVPKTK